MAAWPVFLGWPSVNLKLLGNYLLLWRLMVWHEIIPKPVLELSWTPNIATLRRKSSLHWLDNLFMAFHLVSCIWLKLECTYRETHWFLKQEIAIVHKNIKVPLSELKLCWKLSRRPCLIELYFLNGHLFLFFPRNSSLTGRDLDRLSNNFFFHRA